jgi:hypothetical protein
VLTVLDDVAAAAPCLLRLERRGEIALRDRPVEAAMSSIAIQKS